MIVRESFDFRANILGLEIRNDWPDERKNTLEKVRTKIFENLQLLYGGHNIKQKTQNFQDLDVEPFSVIAYHNKIYRECKSAFIMCNYYPALTGVCALGERLLNHMVLNLKDFYKYSKYYKKVYDKKSFDNWKLSIDALTEWEVLSSLVSKLFYKLKTIRDDSIHFNQKLNHDSRNPALEALLLTSQIIEKQFGTRLRSNNKWFIKDSPGFPFIREECEDIPFIKEFYLPSAVFVGPYHRLEHQKSGSLHILDDYEYDDKEISDQEFVKLLKEFRKQ